LVRILGISGSPRKSVTEYCVKEALREAETVSDISTEFLSLRGMKIGFCIHCDRCIKEQSIDCVRQTDDATGWAKRFLDFDGYIIGSPVYDGCITAQLAAFLNRMRSFWLALEKDPYFFTRKAGGALAVGGTRHGGQELVLSIIMSFYLTQGIFPVSVAPHSHAGVSIWSQDVIGEKGALGDKIGMEGVKELGRRVALASKRLSRDM
jgi:multimeric flavodoxin WrbA